MKLNWHLISVVDPCDKLSCEFGAKCRVRSDKSAECTCDICEPDSKANPICGKDGKTYSSYCHLRAAGCKQRQVIMILKNEPCGKLTSIILINFY